MSDDEFDDDKLEHHDIWDFILTRSDDKTTVSELRERWGDIIANKGGYCCVCSRWGKINPRTINSTMAKSFIWLCKEKLKTPNDKWVDVQRKAPKSVLRTSQLAAMKYWGLVQRPVLETEYNELHHVKHTGLWRPTQRGWDFYYGTIAVPKKVFIYNDRVVKESDELTLLKDCFENRFDYAEVMQSTFADD